MALKQPSLSFPETFERSQRDQILRVISDKNLKFLGGFFINAATTLRYGGNTKALNSFLSDLSACPGAKVEVSIDEEGRFSDATWQVFHSAWGDAQKLHVSVNARSPKYNPKILMIPASVKRNALVGNEGESAN